MLKQLSKLAIRLKAFIYLSKCGRNLRIGHSSHIGGYKNIIIGDNFFSGPFLYLNTNNISSIRIGSDVMLGPDVKIISGNHITTHKFSAMNRAPEKKEGDDKGITIEDDIWIGAGAMILDGAIVSEGAVIAAGSVVTKYIPPYVIAGGVPAKILKPRFTFTDLSILLRSKNSQKSIDEIRKIYDKMHINFPEH